MTVGDKSSLGHDIGLTEEEKRGEQPKPTAWGETAAAYHWEEKERPKLSLLPKDRKEESFQPQMKKADLFGETSVLDSYRKEERREAPEVSQEALFENVKAEEPIIPLGQVSDCFILCKRGMDLFIIDQHAAHERVRYDRLAARAEGIPVQEILVPYLIHVDMEDMDILEDQRSELERLGITFEQAGPDVIRITGSPEDLSQTEMERVMKDILLAFHEQNVPSPETMRHRMMAYAACRGAVKRGDPLNIRQMKELITDLFHTTRPFVCPHGRPTIVKFTPEELGRLFKRP